MTRTPRKLPLTTAGRPSSEDRFGDLLLTAPVFLVYHLGVVFLSVRNGFDPITDVLLLALHRSLGLYLGITFGLAAILVVAVRWFGLTRSFRPARLAMRLGEALVYAVVMALVARHVAAFTLGPRMESPGPVAAVVLSFGAGFYEEIAFRVILFGGGAWLIGKTQKGARAIGLEVGWAFCAAAAFSAVHYIGSLSDDFALKSFVFRLTCGLVLTAVYRLRGFATAVWTHALYDVGVML